MKVISEQFKILITSWILGICAFIILLDLIPVCITVFGMTKPSRLVSFLFCIIFLLSISALAMGFSIEHISFFKLLRLRYFLRHGIYTKAKVIDIQETKKHTTFYLQLMHPEYKNVIVEETVPFWKYHNKDKSTNRIKEIPILEQKNLLKQPNHISNVEPYTDVKIRDKNITLLNEYSYLTINSIVPVLYNPDNDKVYICSLWDMWRRKHWLDDYNQDNIEYDEIYKQRTINKLKVFQDSNLIRKISLIILVISLLFNKGIFITIAMIECWLFLLGQTTPDDDMNHTFYEYSVATMGTITSCTEITERDGKDTDTFWEYRYTFTTPDGTPYQGQIQLDEKPKIVHYRKNSPATVLYDPYCIAQNCLAFYYSYSWIQPEETKKFYKIPITQPEYTNDED